MAYDDDSDDDNSYVPPRVQVAIEALRATLYGSNVVDVIGKVPELHRMLAQSATLVTGYVTGKDNGR